MWVNLPDSQIDVRVTVIYLNRNMGKKGIYRDTVVRASVGDINSPTVIAEGIASCSPLDQFCKLTGRRLAVTKMFEELKKAASSWTKKDRRAIFNKVCGALETATI